MSMKSFTDTIGNGNRDLQACSAVPQPTAPVSFSIHYANNYANAVLLDSAHSLQPGVLYFQNDIRFLGTQVIVINNPHHWLRNL